MATLTKLSSISLYVSQYLSKYAFRVSPSCIDNDNKALKGRGALLFVMKREPKAWVSYLYESMEFVFKPLNHLIATSPKLDWKILHISVSFLKGTTILWLN